MNANTATAVAFPGLKWWENLNLDLLDRAVTRIEGEPSRHRQDAWGIRPVSGDDAPSCGTAFCLAGHVLDLSGRVTRWGWDTEADGVTQRLTWVSLDGDHGALHVGDAANRVLDVGDDAVPDALLGFWDARRAVTGDGDALPRDLYDRENTRAELRLVVDALRAYQAAGVTP